MVSNLYQKDNYGSLNYLVSSYIREYDISKANINILFSKNLISKEQYDYFYNANKIKRNIEVGLLQRDNKHIKEGLNEGFKEYRKKFFEANNIQDEDILLIKKDAVFLVNRTAQHTQFDSVKFSEKNIYTSYYKINNIEFLYYLDTINKIETLDTKGIGEIDKHQNYLLDFFKYIFESAQIYSIDEVIYNLSNFINDYINLNLEIGYYREFNGMNKFKYKSTPYTTFYAEWLPEKDKCNIDINYNLGILNTILSYYTEIYLGRRR